MRRLDLDLGSRLVPYREAWDLQRRVHGEVAAARRGPTLILVEHESVYTVGRRTHSWERPASDDVEGVPVIDVDRGGKTTWHGPGQLTVYPIVRLACPIDVIKYVRALEAAVPRRPDPARRRRRRRRSAPAPRRPPPARSARSAPWACAWRGARPCTASA